MARLHLPSLCTDQRHHGEATDAKQRASHDLPPALCVSTKQPGVTKEKAKKLKSQNTKNAKDVEQSFLHPSSFILHP
jgi:hypothetical protein